MRAVKMALINALSSELLLGGPYDLIPDIDAVDLIDFSSVRQLSMVGAFKTFLDKFKTMEGLRLHVVEKRKEALRGDELPFFVPADRAAEAFERSDVVIITGATVANDTIDGLLDLVRAGTTIIVVGPTASLIPDAFFARNVGVVGCAMVTDANQCLDLIAQGGDAMSLFGDGLLRKVSIINKTGCEGPAQILSEPPEFPISLAM